MECISGLFNRHLKRWNSHFIPNGSRVLKSSSFQITSLLVYPVISSSRLYSIKRKYASNCNQASLFIQIKLDRRQLVILKESKTQLISRATIYVMRLITQISKSLTFGFETGYHSMRAEHMDERRTPVWLHRDDSRFYHFGFRS